MTATILTFNCEICYGIGEKDGRGVKTVSNKAPVVAKPINPKGPQHREGPVGIPDLTNIFTDQPRNTYNTLHFTARDD
jgi:hypothetical protein